MTTMTPQGLRLWMPGTYRISVQGNLPESWSDRLGGMAITATCEADQAPVTTLYGQMRDQGRSARRAEHAV